MCAQVDRPNATSRQSRRISSPSRAKITVQLTTDGRAKLTAYQRQLTLSYAANVRRRLGRKRPGAADFVEWLADHADLLGLDFPPAELASCVDEPSAADWRRLARIIDDARQERPPTRDPVAQRLHRLGTTVGLSLVDVAILVHLMSDE